MIPQAIVAATVFMANSWFPIPITNRAVNVMGKHEFPWDYIVNTMFWGKLILCETVEQPEFQQVSLGYLAKPVSESRAFHRA